MCNWLDMPNNFIDENAECYTINADKTVSIKFYHRNDRYTAMTLNPSQIGNFSSGWTIAGEVVENYYQWVNRFTAVHIKYGIVKGDFEEKVKASSLEAYEHFYKHHPYTIWDYQDI